VSIMEKSWLARLLRLVTDISLILWLALMCWVLFIMVQQRLSGGSGIRQGSVYTEIQLPSETVQAATDDFAVFNFEVSNARIHYRTDRASSLSDIVRAISGVVIVWGLVALILWQLRQILTSFVQGQPLTLENARRFRLISLLLILGVISTAVLRSIEYIGLAPHFSVLPTRGFIELIYSHVTWSRLFTAFLILLLSEALRLGAEHRIDSESVI